VHGWDIAAGCVIVQEAGGVYDDPYGLGEFDVCGGRVIVGNKILVDKFKKIITPPKK